MIAKVRIAPVEKWCDYMLSGVVEGTREQAPGMEVSILTETMGIHPICGGRYWLHSQDSVNECRDKVNAAPVNDERWLCEHMLEMD